MNDLVSRLLSFNRKERFAVFREISGISDHKFPLCEDFRRKLETSLGNVNVPNEVFCAADYHLDWIELAVHTRGQEIKTGKEHIMESPNNRINETQEDIDLLIAFSNQKSRAATHVLLIEAKSYGYWGNNQLLSKVERLKAIFGEHGDRASQVSPHFVLMTNYVSENINTEDWPSWMKNSECKPNWLEYDLPCRLKPTRCSPDGVNDSKGKYLRFDSVP